MFFSANENFFLFNLFNKFNFARFFRATCLSNSLSETENVFSLIQSILLFRNIFLRTQRMLVVNSTKIIREALLRVWKSVCLLLCHDKNLLTCNANIFCRSTENFKEKLWIENCSLVLLWTHFKGLWQPWTFIVEKFPWSSQRYFYITFYYPSYEFFYLNKKARSTN